MALTINKNIVPDIVANAYRSGMINQDSSPMVAIYQISRYWRELFQSATPHRSDILPKWSEKEVAAAKIIISTFLFLSMEKCEDIEELIKDTVKISFES